MEEQIESLLRYDISAHCSSDFGCSDFSHARWIDPACVEGNLALVRGNQSTSCRVRSSHLCGFSENEGQGLQFRSFSSSAYDWHAYDRLGLDDSGQRGRLFDRHVIGAYVSNGMLSSRGFLEAIPLKLKNATS